MAGVAHNSVHHLLGEYLTRTLTNLVSGVAGSATPRTLCCEFQFKSIFIHRMLPLSWVIKSLWEKAKRKVLASHHTVFWAGHQTAHTDNVKLKEITCKRRCRYLDKFTYTSSRIIYFLHFHLPPAGALLIFMQSLFSESGASNLLPGNRWKTSLNLICKKSSPLPVLHPNYIFLVSYWV